MQLASLFFTSSGVFNDLLVIRACLTLGFIFLLVFACMGPVSFKDSFQFQGEIAVDTIIWSVINILIHGCLVVRMYWDERPVKNVSEEQDALWRYIYRHNGLSKMQFQSIIAPHLQLLTFEQGEIIPTDDMFYIILDGEVRAQVREINSEQPAYSIEILSGEMFPIQHLHAKYLTQATIFSRRSINPVAATKTVRVFALPVKHLNEMYRDPRTRAAWMGLLIVSLSAMVERKESSTGTALRYEQQRHPLFGPLDPSEEPPVLQAGSAHALHRPLRHFWEYCKQSFIFPWPLGGYPTGLRHDLLPPMDKDVALSMSQIRAAASKSITLNRTSVSELLSELAIGVSCV